MAKGFHLIELLITLSIMMIISSLIYPIYSAHLTHGRRLSAVTHLIKLGAAMEAYHIQYHTYAAASLAKLHFPEWTEDDYYQLSIASADETQFRISATPLGKQAQIDPCGTLSLDANGEKFASKQLETDASCFT